MIMALLAPAALQQLRCRLGDPASMQDLKSQRARFEL